MKRLVLGLAVLAILGETGEATADFILTFQNPVPGTILDANGLGTGFTSRLPGTGGSLPTDDPNLQLSSGSLLITSTHTDINYGGVNLGVAEAPGFYLPIGNSNITISTRVDNIDLPQGSDQLFLYAGTSSSNTLRGGPHNTGVYFLIRNDASTSGDDDALFVTSRNTWMTGDDVIVSLSRVNGLWSIAWDDLTNPSLSGHSPSVDVPSLDGVPDLYLGIYAANAGTTISATNRLEYFSVDVASVPEPSSLTLLGLGSLGLLAYRWRRWKRDSGVFGHDLDKAIGTA